MTVSVITCDRRCLVLVLGSGWFAVWEWVRTAEYVRMGVWESLSVGGTPTRLSSLVAII